MESGSLDLLGPNQPVQERISRSELRLTKMSLIGPSIPLTGCSLSEMIYEPSCSSGLGCLGLHVVCEETSSPSIREYGKSSFELSENTISTWGPEYKVSFDLRQVYKNTKTGYIFQFIANAHNGASGACEDSGGYVHAPSLHWYQSNSKKLKFGYCVNNVHSFFEYEIERMEWSAIEIGQRLVGESSYEFYIKIRLGFK